MTNEEKVQRIRELSMEAYDLRQAFWNFEITNMPIDPDKGRKQAADFEVLKWRMHNAETALRSFIYETRHAQNLHHSGQPTQSDQVA